MLLFYCLLELKHQQDLSHHSTFSLFSRMQKLAQEQNEEIEKVNRERKYHQVITLWKYFLHISPEQFFSLVYSVIWNFVLLPHQQTTAYELNALSQEWRQLCMKNMEIQSACAVLETQIDSFKREAAERWSNSCLTSWHRSRVVFQC